MNLHERLGLYKRLSYYESKLRLLRSHSLEPTIVSMGCWDAKVPRSNLGNPRGYKRFVKRCMKYYTRKIREIKKELGYR